jgi:hypothetical protein
METFRKTLWRCERASTKREGVAAAVWMKMLELDSITRTASAALVIMVVSFHKGTKGKRMMKTAAAAPFVKKK